MPAQQRTPDATAAAASRQAIRPFRLGLRQPRIYVATARKTQPFSTQVAFAVRVAMLPAPHARSGQAREQEDHRASTALSGQASPSPSKKQEYAAAVR